MNGERVTANVIGKCANDNPLASRCAKSYVLPAYTKANSENEAKVIVRGIAKPAAASSPIAFGPIHHDCGAEAMMDARLCPIFELHCMN